MSFRSPEIHNITLYNLTLFRPLGPKPPFSFTTTRLRDLANNNHYLSSKVSGKGGALPYMTWWNALLNRISFGGKNYAIGFLFQAHVMRKSIMIDMKLGEWVNIDSEIPRGPLEQLIAYCSGKNFYSTGYMFHTSLSIPLSSKPSSGPRFITGIRGTRCGCFGRAGIRTANRQIDSEAYYYWDTSSHIYINLVNCSGYRKGNSSNNIHLR